jgi:hypothetical protein
MWGGLDDSGVPPRFNPQTGRVALTRPTDYKLPL